MATSQETGTRKLAAIMFTDIKAFSWKMASNEVAAMQILKTHDAMMKEGIDQFGGRVIKSIGDSFMVDFPSAVNAVSCAIELQKKFWEYNKGKSDFDKIEVRMGIHLGDVIDVGNDMFGDGVNIASRVEAITEPNRICITQDIYSQVKKKMKLNVFNIGSMKFKNIDEPIGVYEILLDSIPELSTPSATARQAPSRKVAEKISEQEAKEAQSVEAARAKLEEQKKDQIKVHYKKAEIYFEKGMYDEAEAELSQIERLTTPTAAKEEKPTKEEDESQKKIQNFYKKAEEAFHEGKLEEAEKFINEIYRLVPIHYGAQMIMAQIEEARFKLAEERRRKIEAERRAMQERADKIAAFLGRAHEHEKRDELDQALEVLQELFAFDAENKDGKTLQETILRRKAELEELERARAEEAERRMAEVLEQRKLEQARITERQEIVPEKKPVNTRLFYQAGLALVGVVVLYFLIITIQKTFFPTTASLAVLAVELVDESEEISLSKAVSTLLAEDLARYRHVFVVAPTSALTVDPAGKAKADLAAQLNVRQLLLVGATREAGEVVLNVELFDVEKKSLWAEKLTRNTLLELPALREQIVGTVLDLLGIDADAERIVNGTQSVAAFGRYMIGIAYLERRTLSSVTRGMQLLQEAVAADRDFGDAHAMLGRGNVLLYRLGDGKDQSLVQAAVRNARTAIEHSPESPYGYQVLGAAQRYLQQFGQARTNLQRALEILPGNAECHRLLAELALIEGNHKEATDHANIALKLDPLNPDTYVLLGILHHARGEYEAALLSYDRAIEHGANDSLITLRYKSLAWMAPEMDRQAAIDFYEKQLRNNPSDYRYYYWLARTYERVGKRFEGPGQATYQRGIAIAESVLTSNPADPNAKCYLGLLYARFNGDRRGIGLINEAIAAYPQLAEYRYRKANLHAIFGEQERQNALDALEKALSLQYEFHETFNPDFDAISSDPEFRSLLVRRPSSE